jgi:hypothetical protein
VFDANGLGSTLQALGLLCTSREKPEISACIPIDFQEFWEFFGLDSWAVSVSFLLGSVGFYSRPTAEFERE